MEFELMRSYKNILTSGSINSLHIQFFQPTTRMSLTLDKNYKMTFN